MAHSASVLASTSDENFAVHATWFHRHTPGMIVRERDGFVLSDSRLPCETLNVVCCARFATERQALAGIGSALEHFASANQPFSWWSSLADEPASLPSLFERRGLLAAESELAMALDLAKLNVTLAPPAELNIQRVATLGQLRDFAIVSANHWNPPDQAVIEFYERAAPVALNHACPVRLFVGYLGSKPVATSELTMNNETVGVYNVATLAAYRRRGYGTGMVVSPLMKAKREGYTWVVLQATAPGVGIYQKVGFRTYGQVTEYKLRL